MDHGVDWGLFKAGQGADFTGQTIENPDYLGDLDADFDHDLDDFWLFEPPTRDSMVWAVRHVAESAGAGHAGIRDRRRDLRMLLEKTSIRRIESMRKIVDWLAVGICWVYGRELLERRFRPSLHRRNPRRAQRTHELVARRGSACSSTGASTPCRPATYKGQRLDHIGEWIMLDRATSPWPSTASSPASSTR